MSELTDRMKTHCYWCSKCKACRADELAAAAELDRLQAIVDKLPKCWRLLDGKLVQDVPVELDATLWKLDYKDEPVDVTVTGKKQYSDAEWWAVCSDFAYPVCELYDSREAAEAAREKGDA